MTHPDVVRMKPSWVPRHVLGQVCVLREMVEKLMLVVLERCPKADHRHDCHRYYEVQDF